MIKENDLRIGNYLEYLLGEDGCQWDTTKIDWQDLKWCTEKNETFNKVHRGIPITNEILLKCGFKLIDTVNMGFIKYLPIYTHTKDFIYINTKFYGASIGNEDKKYQCFLEDIKYLHLMQNLYFALTGVEIEINL